MVFRVSCPEDGYRGTELSECAAAAPRAHSRSLLHHDNAVALWQGDEQELVILDERIHRAIDRCAHNQLLETMPVQYYVLALRIRRLALHRRGIQEHGRPPLPALPSNVRRPVGRRLHADARR